MYYHCATTTFHGEKTFPTIFFLHVQVMVVGCKPSTLGLRGSCSTTVLPLEPAASVWATKPFPYTFSFLVQAGGAELKPSTYDDMSIIQPLCYYCWSRFKTFFWHYLPSWCQQQQLESNP
jgi:hypothetical protein